MTESMPEQVIPAEYVGDDVSNPDGPVDKITVYGGPGNYRWRRENHYNALITGASTQGYAHRIDAVENIEATQKPPYVIVYATSRGDGDPDYRPGQIDPLKLANVIDLAGELMVTKGEIGVPVHGAPASGVGLMTNGHLGADLLFVAGGKRFPVHTHPGDHLLYCVAGEGTMTIDETTYQIHPGDLYMVDGMVPHAVGAITDHVILAIGAPHKPVDSPERMAWTDWQGRKVDTPIQAGDIE